MDDIASKWPADIDKFETVCGCGLYRTEMRLLEEFPQEGMQRCVVPIADLAELAEWLAKYRPLVSNLTTGRRRIDTTAGGLQWAAAVLKHGNAWLALFGGARIDWRPPTDATDAAAQLNRLTVAVEAANRPAADGEFSKPLRQNEWAARFRLNERHLRRKLTAGDIPHKKTPLGFRIRLDYLSEVGVDPP